MGVEPRGERWTRRKGRIRRRGGGRVGGGGRRGEREEEEKEEKEEEEEKEEDKEEEKEEVGERGSGGVNNGKGVRHMIELTGEVAFFAEPHWLGLCAGGVRGGGV